MRYSLSRNGQVLGTYSEAEIRTYIQAGRIVATDYLLPEGGTQWILVGQFSLPQETPSAAPAPSVATPAAAAAPAAAASPSVAAATSAAASSAGRPGSHMVWSILVTLFCCPPFGIAAIVSSANVDSRFDAGDVAGAKEASRRAAMFCWIGAGGGLLVGLVIGAFALIGALADR